MAEKSRRSAVWDFGYEKTGDGMATCTRCNPPKDFAYCGGTTRSSNLRNHLRDVHKVDFADAAGGDKPKQGGISSFFKPTKVSPARSTSCDDRVVESVCRDLRPASVVTGDGFLSLVNFLEPGYRVPSVTQ